MYLLSLALALQANCLLCVATSSIADAVGASQYLPTKQDSSDISSTPMEVTARNISLTNGSSVSVLSPTWLQNVKIQLHRLLADYEFRDAKGLHIMTSSWTFQSDQADDFRRIHMELRLNASVAVHYFTPIGGQWGAAWSRLQGTFPPEPDQTPYEILDMRVDLQEAFRVSKLAGLAGPWHRVVVRRLPYRDPYYAPGQMYYVFYTAMGDTHAVGAIDRVFVRNFPRLPSNDPTRK